MEQLALASSASAASVVETPSSSSSASSSTTNTTIVDAASSARSETPSHGSLLPVDDTRSETRLPGTLPRIVTNSTSSIPVRRLSFVGYPAANSSAAPSSSAPTKSTSQETKKLDSELTSHDAINLGSIGYTLPTGEYPVLARRYVDSTGDYDPKGSRVTLLVVTNFGRIGTLTVRLNNFSWTLFFNEEQEGYCFGYHGDERTLRPNDQLNNFTLREAFPLTQRCLQGLRKALGVWRDVPWVNRKMQAEFFLAGYAAAVSR